MQYNDIGEGHECVVLLHGSGPGATAWFNFERNIDPLLEAGYRVLLIDCPGWGKSDSLVCTGSRSDLYAAAVRGVLDTLGIEKVHLVGNSMGGHNATAFALANPERVGRMIMMGGGTGGPSLFNPMPTEGIKQLQLMYREMHTGQHDQSLALKYRRKNGRLLQAGNSPFFAESNSRRTSKCSA